MKICHISDTHGVYFRELEPGDILIHSGDGLLHGELNEVPGLGRWFNEQDYKLKIFVPGNHDRVFEAAPHACRSILREEANVVTLINEGIIDLGILGLPDIKIWGSPFSKEFNSWAFMMEDEKLARVWDMIPSNTDILITHGPAYRILDMCNPGTHECAGSKSLLKRIQEVKPKYHLFGHIHCNRGECFPPMEMPTHFYNSSVVDDELNVTAEPHYFEY